MQTPLFSILHTSARPEKWREIYDAWISAAVHPEQVEYVLCVDERWGFDTASLRAMPPDLTPYMWPVRDGLNVICENKARRCYVDGVNTAAQASTGRILIVNADDQYPCEGWDVQLRAVLWKAGYILDAPEFDGCECVIEVSTGTPNEHDRGILVMPILSRARYERLGYVFYPEYESMFADNEFCEHARQDGVIIDARHLLFPHRHFAFDGHGWLPPEMQPEEIDEAYKAQNRREAFELGAELLKIRRLERFDPAKQHDIVRGPERPSIRTLALCLSGELMHWEWVQALLNLHQHLGRLGFQVWIAHEFTSNVYVTREQIRKVMMQADPRPELFLWLDDDNPAPTPEQFDLLLKDLDERPDVDGVTAWCWIYNVEQKTFYPSVGMWSPDNLHWRPFDPAVFPTEREPRPVEASGFPCFLMRYSALEKAGNRPFLPILDDLMDHGIAGEDHAFCHRAQAGGAKFLVEPRVRVKHLKWCDAVPDVPRVSVDPKIAVMMRVKNEARWIERCINSVIPLAGENVYVMDDESTDNTLELARATGVNVFSDPFSGQPLDETRDKDWLLSQVRNACDPDWVLCIDGDEELEPGGAEKLRRILSTNPAVDVFALGFLFCWDAPDQIRVDGRYASMQRESLFRPKTGITFKSYYEGKDSGDPKCHVGLHCGNAPNGRGELVIKPLAVFLLHYGYLFKEDRIRKYNWYRSIDPDNPYEDNYRHMVLGDLPELPADMKVEFGGPLRVVKLPASITPTFDVLPEPLQDEVTA